MTQPDPDLRDRIIDKLLAPRYGGPQHNTPGGLSLTATPEEARRHRAGQIADLVLAVLPAPDNQAAAWLAAADVAEGVAVRLHNDGEGVRAHGAFDVMDELRRTAAKAQSAREVQQDPAQDGTEACGCPNEDAIEHQFGVEDCTCIPFTRQTNPPRYLNQPTDTVDMISGWERGRDCPHHRTAVAGSGQTETDEEALAAAQYFADELAKRQKPPIR